MMTQQEIDAAFQDAGQSVRSAAWADAGAAVPYPHSVQPEPKLSRVQLALDRAEVARSFLNSSELTEEAFGAAETEWIEAQADLSVEVELALGVPPQRLAALLS